MIQLSAPLSFAEALPEQRAKVCNGVGAEWFPAWLRAVLDSPAACYGVSLRPAADIHDFEYSVGITEGDKIVADKRFGRNCMKLVKETIPWYRFVRRSLALTRTKECYLAVRWGGNKAFWAGKIA